MSDPKPGPSDVEAPSLTTKAGEFLFRNGTRADRLFLVQSGQFELVRQVGGSDRRIAVVGPGDLIGLSTLAGHETHDASARALTTAACLAIDVDLLGRLTRQRPEIGLLAARRVADVAIRIAGSHDAPPPAAAVPAVARPTIESPEPALRQGASRPTPHQAPPAGPRLVHEETSREFPLPADHEVLVGRSDPRTRFEPAVDLSGVDSSRSLSRRHAKIVRNGDEFAVVEEPRVANGTFVNGRRLAPGMPAPVGHGDKIAFGLVRTVFWTH